MLSWHAADDDGERRRRSLFVDDVCDLFDASPGRLASRRGRSAPAGRHPAADCARRSAIGPLREESCSLLCAATSGRHPRCRAGSRCPVRWFVERMLRARRDRAGRRAARARRRSPTLRCETRCAGCASESGSARLTPRRLAPRARAAAGGAPARTSAGSAVGAPERRPGVAQAPARGPRTLPRARRRVLGARSSRAHLELGFGSQAGTAARRARGVRPRRRRADARADRPRRRGRRRRGPSSTTTRARWLRRPARSGSPRGTSRWRSTCSPWRSCSASGRRGLLPAAVRRPTCALAACSTLTARSSSTASGATCTDGEQVRELLEEASPRPREAAGEAAQRESWSRARHVRIRGGGCMYPTICRCEP